MGCKWCPSALRWIPTRAYIIMAIELIIGVVLAFAIFAVVRTLEDQTLQSELSLKTEQLESEIRSGFELYPAILNQLGSFFAASGFVDDQEFQLFVGGLLGAVGVEQLTWFPAITDVRAAANLSASTKARSTVRFPGFFFEQADGTYEEDLTKAVPRAMYTPLGYQEPPPRMDLGRDVSEEPTVLAEMVRIFSNFTTDGTPITEDSERNYITEMPIIIPFVGRAPIMLLHSMRSESQIQSDDTSQEYGIYGILGAGLDMDPLIQSLIPVDPNPYKDLKYGIFSHVDANLYSSRSTPYTSTGQIEGSFRDRRRFAVLDRTWTVQTATTTAFVNPRRTYLDVVLLAITLALTLVLFIYLVYNLLSHRTEFEARMILEEEGADLEDGEGEGGAGDGEF